jgi:hypothetical protein
MKTPSLIVSNVKDIICLRKANKISLDGGHVLIRSADSKKRVESCLPTLSLATHRKFFSNYSALQKLRS